MDAQTTCPKCHAVSHHQNDVEFGWCARCDNFHFALGDDQPMFLNQVMADILKAYRGWLIDTPALVGFELFKQSGRYWHRAFLKTGNVVQRHSKGNHASPEEALLELHELVTSKK